MSRKSRILFTILLLAALAAVCFAPSVNLEPTALRAPRAAALLMLAIFVVSHSFVSSRLSFRVRKYGWRGRSHADAALPAESNLIDLLCSRLC